MNEIKDEKRFLQILKKEKEYGQGSIFYIAGIITWVLGIIVSCIRYLGEMGEMTSEDIDKKRAEEETFAGILEGGGCSKEDIPTVKEFRAAFMYLRRVLGIDTQMQDLDVWQTAGIISREYMTDISQLMLNIILCVLCETGIAEMSRYNENHVLIKLNKTTGKVNLDESEILIRLKCGILN